MIGKLEGFLSKGRGIRNAVLEYKESVNSLSGSVFETVSSFSIREGGRTVGSGRVATIIE